MVNAITCRTTSRFWPKHARHTVFDFAQQTQSRLKHTLVRNHRTMSSQNAFEPVQEWIFVETEPKSAPSQGDKKLAHRKRIRAQAAKVSSNARLETIRKRVPKRTTQPVEHVFQVALSGGSGQRRQLRPLASACEERESEVLAAQYRGGCGCVSTQRNAEGGSGLMQS
ncbi:hypothetical protein CB0940_02218 [Cercospora beticola]|uniref:Uncharacterized protein n=1 Tax=Cercospora beticola TaxID=122368 RepID=A0A2G5I9G5_CERBT|nr:hypothetical protein CB0940_02218 [Cercospora beticola]PIB01419.1 hypothetical protein CB0940_02218 [Cercospora beticola]